MENKIYRIRLLDNVSRTPEKIEKLLFSSRQKAKDYIRENNLNPGWWTIDEENIT